MSDNTVASAADHALASQRCWIIMGPQGAGKGTQAALIARHYGVVAISTGDIFRENLKNHTPLGVLAQQYMDNGELVPDEVTNQMVQDRLAQPDVQSGFLLDGYPRNAAQVESLDATLAIHGWSVSAVIELAADRTELLSRLYQRAQVEGRTDDTDEAIARRLDIYAEQTAPLTTEYAHRGVLLQVDGLGTVDDVFARIRAGLDLASQ